MNETLKDSAIRDMRSTAMKQGAEIETLRAERLEIKRRLIDSRDSIAKLEREVRDLRLGMAAHAEEMDHIKATFYRASLWGHLKAWAVGR